MKLAYPSTLLGLLLTVYKNEAFSPSIVNASRKSMVDSIVGNPLKMAGMGMGMASSKSKKKKKGSKKSGGSGGSFDVSKSLLKLEKLYEDLCNDAAKSINADEFFDEITTEYVIAARMVRSDDTTIPGSNAVSDWIPVAQLCINRAVRDDNESNPRGDKVLNMAISCYCREISYAATLAAPIFNSIPRNLIEYSVEPIDSFYKFVYDDVIEGKNEDSKNDMVMNKAEAREVLSLDENCNDGREIKQAYRKQTFTLHPDRFVGVERSEDEVQKASNEFARVKIAYESLTSGMRSNGDSKAQSWYESLGGRSRTDFSGALDLMPLKEATQRLPTENKYAVAGLTSELAMAFVARNQAASV